MSSLTQHEPGGPHCQHCELIMESVADGIFAVDTSWRITSFNRAAERITGFTREQAIGRHCFDVLRADACGRRCPVREAIESADAVSNRRVTILTAKGDEVPLSISASPLYDERGAVVGGVETFRDLSIEESLRKQLEASYTYCDIVGKHPRMQQLFKILPAVAESGSTVLIEGESGTGKELFARAVHDLSPREERPYVVVNCSALPESLLESELFGYKKGAFTDAKKDKPGRFELARGGTIFLDEIATLTPQVQVKLLRVLETGQYEPLGGTAVLDADARVIAATNKPLRLLVEQDKFRDDLFYRLNVVTLELPPLRERPDDLVLLIDHFIAHFNTLRGRAITGIAPEALRVLMDYDFPGNVRELQNIIEYAFVVCCNGAIQREHLPASVTGQSGQGPAQASGPARPAAFESLACAEARVVQQALRRNRGHRGKTATELGISATTLWRKMRKYGIEED